MYTNRLAMRRCSVCSLQQPCTLAPFGLLATSVRLGIGNEDSDDDDDNWRNINFVALDFRQITHISNHVCNDFVIAMLLIHWQFYFPTVRNGFSDS